MADLEMLHCQNSKRTTLNVLINPLNQNIGLPKNTISVEETSKGAHSTKKGLVEDSKLFQYFSQVSSRMNTAPVTSSHTTCHSTYLLLVGEHGREGNYMTWISRQNHPHLKHLKGLLT